MLAHFLVSSLFIQHYTGKDMLCMHNECSLSLLHEVVGIYHSLLIYSPDDRHLFLFNSTVMNAFCYMPSVILVFETRDHIS